MAKRKKTKHVYTCPHCGSVEVYTAHWLHMNSQKVGRQALDCYLCADCQREFVTCNIKEI